MTDAERLASRWLRQADAVSDANAFGSPAVNQGLALGLRGCAHELEVCTHQAEAGPTLAANRVVEAERDALWAQQLETEARATANLALAEEWEDEAMRLQPLLKAADAQLAALRQQLEQLADGWTKRTAKFSAFNTCARELRALLTPEPSPSVR